MVNFWQRKYYFCCNESAQLSLEKNTLANEAISKYKRETALRRSLWQLPNRHCERVHFTNEAISKYERETALLRSQWQQTVIARECTLRPKPSLSTRERLLRFVRCENYRTVIARECTLRTKQSPSTRERLLHFVRGNKKMSLRESVLYERSHLQVRERDCFTSFAVTTNRHCERVHFATEAISTLGGR